MMVCRPSQEQNNPKAQQMWVSLNANAVIKRSCGTTFSSLCSQALASNLQRALWWSAILILWSKLLSLVLQHSLAH